MALCGIKKNDLVKPPHSIKHVGGGKMNIIGSCFLPIKHNDVQVEELVYFVEGVQMFFLSLAICKKIKLVHSCFPYIKVELPIDRCKNVNSNAIITSKRSLPERPKCLPLLRKISQN